ncbi:hypothetical protein MAR_025844 [Mya arenaria]|uniref:Uncharacterized protein n=1 Tax=Mya arenaria TaxID=6604 RepID=A0ABY7ERV3_MYAAR|nr:hypothetical protein MAR_025844 [Mya arenaria]
MAAFMVAKRCILLSRQVLCPTRLSFSIPRFKRSYCCISLKYVCKDHHRAHLFASYLMRNPDAWYENVMFGHAISFEDYVDRYLKTDLVEKDAYIYKTMMQIQENDKGVWKRLRDSGFFSQKRPVDEYEHVLISLNFEKIKEKFNGEFPKELVKPFSGNVTARCGKSVLTQAFAGEIGAPLVNKSRLATSVVDSCKIHKGFIDVDSLKNFKADKKILKKKESNKKPAPEIVEVCKKIAEWKHPQISHPDDKNVYQSTCLRIERASNMAKWVPVPLQSEVIALHRAGHTLLAARLEHFNILPKLVQEPSDPQQFQGFMEVIPPKSLNHSGDQLFNLLSLNMAGVLAELVSRKCLTTVGKNFFEKVQADFKTKIRDQVIMTMKQPELKMALSHTGRSSGTLDEALIADALVERDVNNTIGMIFTQTEEVLQKDRDILQQLTSHFLQHSLKRTEIDYKRVAHILQTSKQFEVWSWDRKTKSTPD